MNRTNPATPPPEPSRDEVRLEALAWAEFLYDEYMLKKHKQLLLDNQDFKIDSNEGNK